VAQWPEGVTNHQLWVRGPDDDLRLVQEFRENSADNDILVFEPDNPLAAIQVIRVVTSQSPSWVSWKEIEILGRMD
jgi:hypothetical protein